MMENHFTELGEATFQLPFSHFTESESLLFEKLFDRVATTFNSELTLGAFPNTPTIPGITLSIRAG